MFECDATYFHTKYFVCSRQQQAPSRLASLNTQTKARRLAMSLRGALQGRTGLQCLGAQDSAKMPLNDEENAQLHDFSRWLTARGCGGIETTVRVGKSSVGGGWGLFAARDIRRGEAVLALPLRTLSLSEETADDSVHREYLAKISEELWTLYGFRCIYILYHIYICTNMYICIHIHTYIYI